MAIEPDRMLASTPPSELLEAQRFVVPKIRLRLSRRKKPHLLPEGLHNIRAEPGQHEVRLLVQPPQVVVLENQSHTSHLHPIGEHSIIQASFYSFSATKPNPHGNEPIPCTHQLVEEDISHGHRPRPLSTAPRRKSFLHTLVRQPPSSPTPHASAQVAAKQSVASLVRRRWRDPLWLVRLMCPPVFGLVLREWWSC